MGHVHHRTTLLVMMAQPTGVLLLLAGVATGIAAPPGPSGYTYQHAMDCGYPVCQTDTPHSIRCNGACNITHLASVCDSLEGINKTIRHLPKGVPPSLQCSNVLALLHHPFPSFKPTSILISEVMVANYPDAPNCSCTPASIWADHRNAQDALGSP